jgi:hypothetical protein
VVGVGIVNLRRRLCRVTVLEGCTVCVSLSVFHLVVVLVTTREACTVCGSLAGVFHPCDQKHSLCGSLGVSPHVMVLVTIHVIRRVLYVVL